MEQVAPARQKAKAAAQVEVMRPAMIVARAAFQPGPGVRLALTVLPGAEKMQPAMWLAHLTDLFVTRHHIFAVRASC